MKVLLVQPFKDTGFGHEAYPPVGLGYLSTALKSRGHEVFLIDCLHAGYTYEKFLDQAQGISPEVIGINLFSIAVPYVRRMVALIKENMPNATIALGGPHVSSLPQRVLGDVSDADFAIRGEGEVPFGLLVDQLEQGRSAFDTIPGLVYRNHGAATLNEPYFARDIEEYGIPDWELIDPRRYFRYLTVGKASVPVFFTRGCPFPCTFCAAKITSGQDLRRRSISHIFKELRFLQSNYGIKRFIIEDEGFGVEKSFILQFCQRFQDEKFKGTFAMGVGMRLDIIDEELLSTMRQSGFERTIVLGIESGTQRILDAMKKRINLGMVREKVDLMDAMGFEPTGYFILGYPGETRQEIQATVNFALDLRIREASFTAFQPLPGTEATRILMDNHELSPDYDFTVLAQNKVAYAPRGMTTHELEQVRQDAIKRFYLRPKILLRYFRSWSLFKYAFKKFVLIFLQHNALE